MSEVAVIGAGAWGTALALQAARAGRTVTLWARHAEAVAPMRESPYLPGVAIPETIRITGILPFAAITLLAVPVQHIRTVAAGLTGSGTLVMCAKGVEAGTHKLPLEVLEDIHPGRPSVVLTGPNFAHEIAAGKPAAAVVAGAARDHVIAALATPGFRLYGNDDAIGAQVGGAAKNVIAIAAGAVIGAGLGENARAALVTRGLAELSRLAVALGGRADTVAGLSGLGDLLLTCTGETSRNFSLGLALGRGHALDEILVMRTAVTEGVLTAPSLVARAEAAGVSLPVCAAVAAVVTGKATVEAAVTDLLARRLRNE